MKEFDLDEIQRVLDGKLGTSPEPTPEPTPEPETPWEYTPPKFTKSEWSDVEVREVDMGWLFDMKELRGLTTKQYRGFEDYTNLYVPDIIPFYEHNVDLLRSMAISSTEGMKTLLIGDTGCGKTSGAEQFAAHTGRPFHRQEFDEFTDDQKLWGSLEMRAGGETYHNKSDLVKCMAYPTVACLDEFSRAPSATAMSTNPFLDRRIARITNHDDTASEVVRAHDDFMICATDNTAGNGDGMDIYNSSNVLDEAIRNRFDLFINVPYPSQEAEARLIEAMAPEMDAQEVKHLSQFSHLMHKAFSSRQVSTAFSIRNLSALTKLTKAGYTMRDALAVNFVNRVAESEKSDVEATIHSVFGA